MWVTEHEDPAGWALLLVAHPRVNQRFAKILQVSDDSVRGRSKRYRRLIDVSPRPPLYGRPFTVPRIPRRAFQRFIEEHNSRRMHAPAGVRRRAQAPSSSPDRPIGIERR
jgi:hypothetical protein